MKSQTILWILIAWLAFGSEIYSALPPVERLVREADEACRKVTGAFKNSPINADNFSRGRESRQTIAG